IHQLSKSIKFSCLQRFRRFFCPGVFIHSMLGPFFQPLTRYQMLGFIKLIFCQLSQRRDSQLGGNETRILLFKEGRVYLEKHLEREPYSETSHDRYDPNLSKRDLSVLSAFLSVLPDMFYLYGSSNRKTWGRKGSLDGNGQSFEVQSLCKRRDGSGS